MVVKTKEGRQKQGETAKVAVKPVAKTPAKRPAAKKATATAAAPEAKKRKTRTVTKKAEPRPAPTVAPVDEPLYKQCGITLQAALFCDHYLTHYNATQAIWDAGYKAANRNVAAVDAHKMMQKPGVRQYIAAKMKAMFGRLEEEQDKLLQTFTFAAYADPNELVEHRIDCCRFCYGDGNNYQFTPQEFQRHEEQHDRAVAEAKVSGEPEPEFDPKGGVGYNPNLSPNEDCPECFGRGRPETVIKDTRFLSPAALTLYAGMKESKDGIEIKLNSQEKARETLAKIRKLYEDNTTVNLNFDAADLQAKFGDKMRKAHERMEQMRAERFSKGEG